jgi:chromate transporter
LNDSQLVDAIAVAMITPGPVVITSAFIGYLVAGLGVRSPPVSSFRCTWLCYSLVPSLAKSREIRLPVPGSRGLRPRLPGAIAGAVYVLGRRAIHDWLTLVMAVVVLVINFRLRLPDRPGSIGRDLAAPIH